MRYFRQQRTKKVQILIISGRIILATNNERRSREMYTYFFVIFTF